MRPRSRTMDRSLGTDLSNSNISQNKEDFNNKNKKYFKQLENNNEMEKTEYVI